MAQLEILPAHIETLARIAHRGIEHRLGQHGGDEAAYWHAVAMMYCRSPCSLSATVRTRFRRRLGSGAGMIAGELSDAVIGLRRPRTLAGCLTRQTCSPLLNLLIHQKGVPLAVSRPACRRCWPALSACGHLAVRRSPTPSPPSSRNRTLTSILTLSRIVSIGPSGPAVRADRWHGPSAGQWRMRSGERLVKTAVWWLSSRTSGFSFGNIDQATAL